MIPAVAYTCKRRPRHRGGSQGRGPVSPRQSPAAPCPSPVAFQGERGMFIVLVDSGKGWQEEASFGDYRTACRYAAQVESSTVRAIVRRAVR